MPPQNRRNATPKQKSAKIDGSDKENKLKGPNQRKRVRHGDQGNKTNGSRGQKAELTFTAKKAKLSPPEVNIPSKALPVESSKIKKVVNKAPTILLDIFIFGDGGCGELGLGSKTFNGQTPTEAIRPRRNHLLSPETIGVVQFACGGMHTVVLTKDNKILTWGVNDLGALGRDTNVEEDEEDELNPAESTPTTINMTGIEHSIKWAQVVASDNASFALTEDGRVYGWGTFRVSIVVYLGEDFANSSLVK
jgi:regulator of chromosome condensation